MSDDELDAESLKVARRLIAAHEANQGGKNALFAFSRFRHGTQTLTESRWAKQADN